MLPNSWVLNMSLTENLTLGWNADISEKHPNQTNFFVKFIKSRVLLELQSACVINLIRFFQM